MQPEPTAHDLNPLATPGRARLPRCLALLPPLLALGIGVAVVWCALGCARWLAARREVGTERARAAALAGEVAQVETERAAFDASLRRAHRIASWCTSGCAVQPFLIGILEALPAGAPVTRVSYELQDLGRQCEVALDFGGSREQAALSLAAIEARWSDAGVRVSARQQATSSGRVLHRLVLQLPQSGRAP